MKRGDEPCWMAVAEARHSLTHTVQQLDALESYRFRVRAENIHGLSEPGMESDVITISSETSANEKSGNDCNIGMENENESEDDFEPGFEARIVSVEPGKLFEECYEVHEKLGKGRYGIVRRIVDKTCGLNLAAKFIRTIKWKDRKQVQDEINIMNILRHPKLLRLAAAYENPKEMIMVTEYISGGELFERVVADDFTLTEKDSILFVRQICQGVEYMHKNNVVHLDLKPENIMCHTRTSHRIKLIDFGLAQTLKPGTPVRVLFGTPEFIPPEIIGFEPIGTESDMWSVGVICYVLLSGLSPFMGENDAETFANITRADHDFDDKAFEAISQEAQDFISALLIKRKELRMSATDCLKHPWLAQRDESMSRVALPTDKLKKFIVRRKWQKTGNALRALGRMATLSANSRRNTSSSPPLSKSFEDDVNQEIFSNNNDEPIVEYTDNSVLATPENSPDELKNISYSSEYDKTGIKIKEINDETEGLQTSVDFSLNEVTEQDSLTILDTQTSYSFDEYTNIEDDENILKFEENNSSKSEHIEDGPSTADCITELPNVSDEISSENDTMFTAIDSSIIENTEMVDVNPNSLCSTITKDRENSSSNFCTFKNIHISEPTTCERIELVIKKIENEDEDRRAITYVETTAEIKKEEISDDDKIVPSRPSFIAIKTYSNPNDCASKPCSKIISSNLDGESEVSRIRKYSPLPRVVRTGSVSRTAKMFEQEELSSPIKSATNPGSRIVIPTTDARPQNERIRKAFAFWNK